MAALLARLGGSAIGVLNADGCHWPRGGELHVGSRSHLDETLANDLKAHGLDCQSLNSRISPGVISRYSASFGRKLCSVIAFSAPTSSAQEAMHLRSANTSHCCRLTSLMTYSVISSAPVVSSPSLSRRCC